MMPAVGVHVRTSRQVRGARWCARYPERAGDLWLVIHGGGRRERIYIGPPTPENVERAERERAEHLAALEIVTEAPAVPLFCEAAAEYLRIGMDVHRLAPSTRDDRTHILHEDGPVLAAFGALRLDAIGTEHLLGWWERFVIEGSRSPSTGRNHLDAIAGVYAFAVQRGTARGSPVDAFRLVLRRSTRTKASRGESDAHRATPVEPPEALGRLVACALAWPDAPVAKRQLDAEEQRQAGDVPAAVLLMLDAGLRLGEVFGLRWRHVLARGRSGRREGALAIEESIARGKHEGRPKSGRVRRVDVSQRLRRVLRARWVELGQPAGEDRVILRREPGKFRKGPWKRLCERAEVGHRNPSDLRDSFASYLLTAGVQLGYVSTQLGHADVAITARHYARYIQEARYRAPMVLGEDDLPADLLARIGHATITPQRHNVAGSDPGEGS